MALVPQQPAFRNATPTPANQNWGTFSPHPSIDSSPVIGPELIAANADLKRSGLSLESLESGGWRAVADASAVHPDFAQSPAIVIPYRGNGEPVTYKLNGIDVPYVRVRYLQSPFGALPRDGRRYDSPKGSGVQIYVPPGLTIHDPSITTLCIVEGEKKAEALVAQFIPAIAVAGVNSFRATGTKTLHPDLARIASMIKARGGVVYIIYDSDAAEKHKVREAELQLASDLALAGVNTRIVRLPQGPLDTNGAPAKVGADDFLVSQGRDALQALIQSTPPLGAVLESAENEVPVSVADLLKRDVQPVPELIPGWLEKGIPTFVCGVGGVHKSRLCLQWGLALNAGADPFYPTSDAPKPFLCEVKPQATLVYVSAEDDENELARRSQAIAREMNLPSPTGGVFMCRKGKDSALAVMQENGGCVLQPFYFSLTARLNAVPGHKVVVFDSAYDFVRFAGRAKIDEDAVNYFIKIMLQGVCDACDCTILIPWHPSQAGSSRAEMDGWSVAWRNAARARLAIKATDTDDEYELTVEKRNHAAKSAPVRLCFVRGALRLKEDVQDEAAPEKLGQIVVKLAVEAAQMGMPFTQQRNIPGSVLDQAGKEIGRKVSCKAFKEELRSALVRRELQYLRGSKSRAAGYYPGELHEAQELARRAKEGGKP